MRRFSGLWEVNTTRSVPAVEALGSWLADNVPASQAPTVVHGDYRIGNLMYAPNTPAQVRAVLDWEMATVGDPLADLGYFAATYAEAEPSPRPWSSPR